MVLGFDAEISEEQAPALLVFLDMLTQWRASFGGVIGLDYAALPVLFDVHRIKKKHRTKVFKQIQLLEIGALEAFNEQAKNKS